MTGPLIDQIRAASQSGLETLAIQIGALARVFKERLKPAERQKMRAARDYLARCLALWRDLFSDEPELVARLESLTEQVRALQRRRGCSLWPTSTRIRRSIVRSSSSSAGSGPRSPRAGASPAAGEL